MNSAHQETTENSGSLDILFTMLLTLTQEARIPPGKKGIICSASQEKNTTPFSGNSFFYMSTNCSDYLET